IIGKKRVSDCKLRDRQGLWRSCGGRFAVADGRQSCRADSNSRWPSHCRWSGGRPRLSQVLFPAGKIFLKRFSFSACPSLRRLQWPSRYPTKFEVLSTVPILCIWPHLCLTVCRRVCRYECEGKETDF